MSLPPKERSSPLVELRPQKAVHLCWTISLPTKYVPKGHNVPWGYLGPDRQYKFFSEVLLPKMVRPRVDGYYFVYELNKAGQLHVHGSVWKDSLGYDELYILTKIRTSLLMDPFVKHVCKIRPNCHNSAYNRAKVLNHICLDDRGTWDDYLMKDIGKLPYPVSYWSLGVGDGEA